VGHRIARQLIREEVEHEVTGAYWPEAQEANNQYNNRQELSIEQSIDQDSRKLYEKIGGYIQKTI